LEELVTELIMCHLHPQQAEQQSAGQCDITRNAEHDGRIAVYDLSNGAIVNDLERSLPPVARSRHSLTLNISETVRDTDIVSTEYQ